MRQIMLDLGSKFERATGHKLVSVFDSTGRIVKRIEGGETVDVVMINRGGIERLAMAGKVIADSVTDVGGSIAAVAVRKGAPIPDISSPEAFKRALLSAKSIARPAPAVGGTSGSHITKVLERLGITDEVNAKSVMYNDVTKMAGSPAEMVAIGQAEIALQQLQDLMAVPGIEIVGPFPGELQGTFMFAAAIIASAKETEAGKLLLQFLQTPEAMAVITAKGMKPVGR